MKNLKFLLAAMAMIAAASCSSGNKPAILPGSVSRLCSCPISGFANLTASAAKQSPVIDQILEIVTRDQAERQAAKALSNEAEQPQEEDAPFVKVEQMPSFLGGDLMIFRNWVQSQVVYPQSAQEAGISGRVLLSFVIERDGSLSGIQVLQSPDRSLSEEAVRVLKQSPRWVPGKQRNQTVRVKYTLPVDFRIQN